MAQTTTESIEALSGPPGSSSHSLLTPKQARILYCRNMVLLLLSLWVGGGTLLALILSRRHTRYNSMRRLTNVMVAILLAIEMIETLAWVVGVNIAGAADGAAPWLPPLSVERADRLCFPVALVDYGTDVMVFLWHTVMSFTVWAWLVRQTEAGLLVRRLGHALAGCIAASVLISVAPIVHGNLGLWDHNRCFVRRAWQGPGHTPLLGILLNRMVLLPLCGTTIIVLNGWTVHHLRKEAIRYHALESVKRLQTRLLIMTTTFVIMWTMQSIPIYIDKNSYALEWTMQWAFGVGLMDALVFRWPTSLTYLCAPCCLPFLKRFFSSVPTTPSLPLRHETGLSLERRQEQQRHGRRPGLPSSTEPPSRARRSTSIWEALLMGTDQQSTYVDDESESWSSVPGRRTEPVAASTLSPYRIFATTFDLNHRSLPAAAAASANHPGRGAGSTDSHAGGGVSLFEKEDPVLAEGVGAWVPALYHLYVIAVQRCRVLAKLRRAIHDHLGGSSHYVLAGQAEMGDTLTGKMALLVFARTVDTESGAFRLLASNQHPVVLRDLRGGCKGMLGLAFRYYDTSVAVINAHLPATSLYAGHQPLEEREKHVASMLQSLRIGGGHELWDAPLQYHHCLLLGNMNFRMHLPPAEMFQRIEESSRQCHARFEGDRCADAEKRVVDQAEWNWRGEAYSRLWLVQAKQQQQEVSLQVFQGEFEGLASFHLDLQEVVFLLDVGYGEVFALEEEGIGGDELVHLIGREWVGGWVGGWIRWVEEEKAV